MKISEENQEETVGKRKREEEKEENETEKVKRRCDGFVSVEPFEIFSQGEDLESCGGSWEDLVEKPKDLSDREPDTGAHVRVVPGVTGMPVSPSSVVTGWFFRVALTGKMLNRSPFLSPKSVPTLVQLRRKRSGLKDHK